MSKAKPCLGYTDCKTVKLDLDDISYSDVQEIVTLTINRFSLKGRLILKSSKNCYHAVFDTYVTWVENVAIMG